MSSSPTTTTTTSTPKKFELRVGQFNVLNLVKENVHYYGKEKYSPAKVDLKVEWIAQQLKRMKCGIVGFEEVFHKETLLRATRLSGLYDDNQVYTFANGTGPSVALASVFPVLEMYEIKDFPKSALLEVDGVPIPIYSFSRPILRAVVELPFNIKATVIVVHAKSKRPIVADKDRHDQKKKAVGHSLSLIIRAAESTALRHVVLDELSKKHPVIVIGDLNDSVNSVTTEIITGTEPWKKLPYDQKQKIWSSLLWSTNEVQIFNDHVIDETLKDEQRTNIESDHGQVVATLKLIPPSERGKKKYVSH